MRLFLSALKLYFGTVLVTFTAHGYSDSLPPGTSKRFLEITCCLCGIIEPLRGTNQYPSNKIFLAY